MLRKYSIGTLLAAMTLLAGCGGAAAGPKNLSGNNSASQLSAASSVQFGTVPVGSTRSSTVAVSNTAANSSNVIVSQISVAGPAFRLANSPALPMTLTPGESVTLGLEFSPLSKGSATGTISIMSDATNPVLPVALTGNGNSGTTVAVSPAVLNFGGVGVGNSAVLSGTLVAGTTPVTVTTVDQSGQGYALSGISFPVTLAAGQQLSFSVTFTPQSAGTSSGSLVFVTDAGTSPSETLTGSGGQSGGHRVDLSWIPDTSPVVGYNLYRGVKSGGPYVKITASPDPGTSYADTSVQSGTTYYYVATSVSSTMQESGYSNQTVATVP